MKSYSVTIQIKAIKQYIPVVLFIMLFKVVLTFESVDESIKCEHWNQSYWTVLSCDAVYFVVQGGSVDEILPRYDHSNKSNWAVLSCGIAYSSYF